MKIIFMAAIFCLFMMDNSFGQRVRFPSGNLYYGYDYYNASTATAKHHNQAGIMLFPELFGLKFKTSLNYHLISSGNGSESGFTFNLSGDKNIYKPDINSLSRTVSGNIHYGDSLVEFDKIRNRISGEQFYNEQNYFKNSLSLQKDSISMGLTVDTLYRQQLESGLIASDSLKKLYDHYLSIYKSVKQDSLMSSNAIDKVDSLTSENQVGNNTLAMVLTNVKNITIGYHHANLSEISLYNYPISGFSFEYGPKPIFLEYRMGTRKELGNSHSGFSSVYNNSDNHVWLIQAGIGDKNATHVHLKYIRHDIKEDQGYFNYTDCSIIGSEFQLDIADNTKIKYELNGLAGNAAIKSGEIETTMNNLAHQFSLSQLFSKRRLRLDFTVLKTDDGYANPGNVNLQPGTFGYNASMNSLLLNGKIQYNAIYRYATVKNAIESVQQFCDNHVQVNISQQFGLHLTYFYSETQISHEGFSNSNRSNGFGLGANYLSPKQKMNVSVNGSLIEFKGPENVKNAFANISYKLSEVSTVIGEMGYYVFDGSLNTFENFTYGLGVRVSGKKWQLQSKGQYIIMNPGDFRLDFSQQFICNLGKKWEIFLNAREAFMETTNYYSNNMFYSTVGSNYKF